MMKTVKHTIYSIGDRGSDLARTFGSETADLARRFGGNTADLALQVNKRGRKLAKRIGPKRALIGLAVLAATIGGTVVLVRYLRLRARAADANPDADGLDAGDSARAARKRARAQHHAEANA